MRKPSSVLVLVVLLAFGSALVVPAEDVPETAYDESEALPYEGVPLFFIAAPLVAQLPIRSVHLKPDTPSSFTSARVRAAIMPIDPPMHGSLWYFSVLCSASNFGNLTSLKNISRQLETHTLEAQHQIRRELVSNHKRSRTANETNITQKDLIAKNYKGEQT